MRVDGQGMAIKTPAIVEASRSTVREEKLQDQQKTRVGVEELVASRTSREELHQAVEVANDIMNLSNFHLEFQLHEDSGHFQVRVIDNETKETVKEIPPDYMLDLTARLREMINQALGLLVDELV
jgi:flagellar protein FlaG